MKKTIGIIGGGNMGEALIKGLHKSYFIYVAEAIPAKAHDLKKKYEVNIANSSDDLAKAQIIILSVKPQDMQPAFSWIRSDSSRNDKLFISIAAGLTTKYFEDNIKNIVLHANPRVIRAMPNMPALINKGMAGICKGQYATDEDLKLAEEILSAIGQTILIKEDMMDALTAVSGSGPSYVFFFVEQWVAAAMALGFSEDVAKRLVLETLIGSADLIKNSNFAVRDLRAMVTSKGGTTEAAIKVFENRNIFHGLIEKALKAAEKKAKELAK